MDKCGNTAIVKTIKSKKMKHLIVTVILVGLCTSGFAQKYLTRTGKVTFFSGTPLENIEAFNNEMACVLDAQKGEFIFQVPIKSFKFDRSLMQEHFNENYLESDKYPKADYKGTITDPSAINYSKDGTYKVSTKGKLTIHGVTKTVSLPGTAEVKGDKVTLKSTFKIIPQDYKIEIPGIVEDKIAKEIEVNVNSILEKK